SNTEIRRALTNVLKGLDTNLDLDLDKEYIGFYEEFLNYVESIKSWDTAETWEKRMSWEKTSKFDDLFDKWWEKYKAKNIIIDKYAEEISKRNYNYDTLEVLNVLRRILRIG